MNGNRFIIILLLVLLRASAIGQTPFDFGPSPCLSAPGFNQLDFWIGNWIVYNTSNTAIGMDTVHSVLDDCVIEEKWVRNNGSRGKSYNTYNPATRLWQKAWVDNRGNSYYFIGEYKNNQLVFQGKGRHKEKAAIFELTYFNRLADNSVRKVWQVSTDNGKSWAMIEDHTFRKSE